MEYIYHLIELVKRLSSYFGLVADKRNFEDAFYQLLHDKNYDEALRLALQHKYLDIDLVYKCKWRNSGITIQSIDNVLGKIQDKLWAINECVQTVPMSYEACRRLIEFGLHEANLKLLYELGSDPAYNYSDGGKHGGKLETDKHKIKQDEKRPLLEDDIGDDAIIELIDFAHLNGQQKELCRCRQNLIRYEHSLRAYENTLGDYRTVQQNFDHVFYDEFRRKCPLNFCLDFANDGDANAVENCLDFYTADLKKHLLAILSNFPETLSPYQYRNLLPCLRGKDKVFEWRSLSGSKPLQDRTDWSSRDRTLTVGSYWKDRQESFETEFYEKNPQLKKFKGPIMTSELLTEWFIERALDIEQRTLLSSCAIQLLHLGTELNIKNLKELHDDLIEFDRIVYDCCTDKDIYLSYQEFKKLSEIDRLILITGDSVKTCKDRFRFYVIPYLHRREQDKIDLEAKTNVLREYFRRLANTREQICRAIYNDLLDRIECDDFVAEWTKGMDDAIDEIGEEIKKIERDRQANQVSMMANQTFALEDFNECYEACQLIMKKNFNECWPICCQLGMNQKFQNNEAKYKLLAFALAHCHDPDGKVSAKILDYIIELRKRDEKIQLAYLKRNM
uniref:Neuroblastoma-amplified sequence n=1 Tax=Aceria tosichella TaxID=561515 RepID=A0A6G1S4G2_9ACAR